jgi:hypothetical protein
MENETEIPFINKQEQVLSSVRPLRTVKTSVSLKIENETGTQFLDKQEPALSSVRPLRTVTTSVSSPPTQVLN